MDLSKATGVPLLVTASLPAPEDRVTCGGSDTLLRAGRAARQNAKAEGDVTARVLPR